MQYYMLSYCLL